MVSTLKASAPMFNRRATVKSLRGTTVVLTAGTVDDDVRRRCALQYRFQVMNAAGRSWPRALDWDGRVGTVNTTLAPNATASWRRCVGTSPRPDRVSATLTFVSAKSGC